MSLQRKILFLSSLDFKEKSIQVIRKTPEAYVAAGWHVIYVVARDDSRFGNYSYERIIQPDGVEVCRFNIPMTSFYDRIRNTFLRTVFSKIRSYAAILGLFWLGMRQLRETDVDVIYGYEVDGVLAANLLKLFGFAKGKVLVSRFQGTFYYSFIQSKNFIKALLNWDHFLAMFLPSHISIMTDDGTQGDKALKAISSRTLKNLRFWVNGVDPFHPRREQQNPAWNVSETDTVLLTVCRLESWKRVDRGILVLSELVNRLGMESVRYFVVGEGSQRESLERLAEAHGVSRHVCFVGAVPQSEVNSFLTRADFFISTYDSSNVGNPLLEAIRANKVILTLNNGDTGNWISHMHNGLIYEVDSNFIGDMADDIKKLISDPVLVASIKSELKNTEKQKLWTWQERFDAEVAAVTGLLTV